MVAECHLPLFSTIFIIGCLCSLCLAIVIKRFTINLWLNARATKAKTSWHEQWWLFPTTTIVGTLCLLFFWPIAVAIVMGMVAGHFAQS